MSTTESRKTLVPPPSGGWISRERVLALALIVVTGLAFYLCYLLALPFLPALSRGLALAIIAHPLHDVLEQKLRRRNLAAVVSVVIVAVAIIAPVIFVLHQLVQQVMEQVSVLQDESTMESFFATIQKHPRLTEAVQWLQTQVNLRDEAGRAATTIAERVPAYLTTSLWVLAQLLITLFVLFYFFRDRRDALQALRYLVPLSHQETNTVFVRVADTVYATIYGSLTVAMIQGLLGGLIFWWLGLPTPLLWGVVMAVLAVIPMGGTFIIWLPTATYLAISGEWGKATILFAWGAIVIALIDNLLYPVLVGNRLRLHPLLVFIAVVGGVALFGAAGIVLGPTTLAVTEALIDIWRRRTAAGGTLDGGAA